jgi:hypothetical protein
LEHLGSRFSAALSTMIDPRGAIRFIIGLSLVAGGCSNVGSPTVDAPVTIPAVAANFRGVAWLSTAIRKSRNV